MKKFNDVLWGLVLIAAATLLIVSRLGIIREFGIEQIVFSAVWICLIISGLIKREIFSVTLGIAFLCIVWSSELGIGAITPWPVCAAAVLVAIGWDMIFKRNSRHKWENNYNYHYENNNYNYAENNENESSETFNSENNDNSDSSKPHYEEGFRTNYEEDNRECVECISKFSGVIKYIYSQNLKSIYAKSTFGGSKIYMDKAKSKDGEILVNVDCTFGGVELYIPYEWNVESNVRCTFGGVTDHQHKPTGTTTIKLTGSAVFGGIDIKYI